MLAFMKGFVLTASGRYQESDESMMALGDWFAGIPLVRSINAVNLGKIEEAKSQTKKALELDPSWTAEKWRQLTFRRRRSGPTGERLDQGRAAREVAAKVADHCSATSASAARKMMKFLAVF